MPQPNPMLSSLQDLVINLALIDRNHYLAKQNRHENDVEHSFAVAILCWYIHSKHSLTLDISKILKYALAHDFVEVKAGDVNTFASPEERAHKIVRERDALNELTDELHDFDDLCRIMQSYEEKEDEEALFVWTVDKMQALLMGDMDDWRPYAELGITYEQFDARYSELLVAASPHASIIFEGLIDYSKSTYYDRPE